MGVFGTYDTAEALLEALDGVRFQYEAQDTFKSNDWGVFDTIDIDHKWESWGDRESRGHSFMTLMADSFFAQDGGRLQVYVQILPTSDMPSEIAGLFNHAHTKDQIKQVITFAAKKGHLPDRMRVYLVGPSQEAFEKLADAADKAWPAHKAENDTKSAAAAKFSTDAKRIAQAGRQVMGWIELTRATLRTSDGNPAFRFKVVGSGIHVFCGSPDHPIKPTRPQIAEMWRPITTRNTAQHVMDVAVQRHVTEAWGGMRKAGFYVFATESHEGPQKTVEHTLDRLRSAIDKARNLPPPKTPVADGPQFEPTFNRSKVVGSIKSEGDQHAHEVVTADDAMRRWMRPDGSMTSPRERVDQRSLADTPADKKLHSMIDNDQYKVVFGIFFDHPLLRPGLKNQTWWYQDKNLMFSAMEYYATVTGDRPNLSYFMSEKIGPQAGMQITERQLRKRTDSESQIFQRDKEELIRRLWSAAERGQQLFPIKMLEKFDFDVEAGKHRHPERAGGVDHPQNPLTDVAPGFDMKKWNEYVAWVRKNFKRNMGLNLAQSAGARWLDSSGKPLPLEWSRSQIELHQRVKNTKKYGGKSKEKWALYLIQYLIAHSSSETGASPTHMLPLNIVRSRKANIPPLKLAAVRETHLKQWMRDNSADFAFFKDTNAWKFLRPNPNMKFPYARLIRPSIVMSDRVLKQQNDKYKQSHSNIRITTRGYAVGGIHFDAYMMMVAMPPSVAEEEFGLLGQGKSAKLIINDPNMLERLRKTKRGKRGTLQTLNLFAAPVAFVGAGDDHPDNDVDMVMARDKDGRPVQSGNARGKGLRYKWHKKERPDYEKLKVANIRAQARLQGNNPTEMGVMDTHSRLTTPENMWVGLGEKHAPIIKAQLSVSGQVVKRLVTGYEHSNTHEQREALWDQYIRDATTQANSAESKINGMMQALSALQRRRRPVRGTKEDEMMYDAQQYLRFVKMEVDNKGNSIRVPQFVKELKLSEFHAPVGSHDNRTGVLAVKAPSADIAKLLILYRLLRRSVSNKTVGKLMRVPTLGGKRKLFPEEHGRLLAQWAAMRFNVVRDEAVYAQTRFKATKYSKNEFATQRSQRYGDHITASMLWVDD